MSGRRSYKRIFSGTIPSFHFSAKRTIAQIPHSNLEHNARKFALNAQTNKKVGTVIDDKIIKARISYIFPP